MAHHGWGVRRGRVELSTDLAASADAVMAALSRVDTLQTLTRGLLAFDSDDGHPLPEYWPKDGSPVPLRVRPFHGPVGWRHTIRVVEVDVAAGRLRSSESGGVVRRWDHTIGIRPTGAHACRYIDIVELDAGVLTWAITAWAALFYRARQRRWRRLAPTLPVPAA